MSIGTSIKSQIEKVITKYGSTVIINPRSTTVSEAQYGGYSGSTEGAGTPVTTLAVPTSFLQNITFRDVGTMTEGVIEIAFNSAETITKDGRITWQGQNYTISNIEPVPIQDVTVAIFVRCNRIG